MWSMTAERKKNSAQANVCPRRPGTGYDEETVYHYFKLAGGSVRGAMRLAAEAGERRTPKDPHTWLKCVKRKDFRARFERETKEEWQDFHALRELKKQHMLDEVAAAIEPLIELYQRLMDEATQELARRPDSGLLLLRKDFALGPLVFERLCRLYLRAVGEPEKITSSQEGARPVTVLSVKDLEGRRKEPKTLQEAKAMVGTIKMPRGWEIEEEAGV